MVDWANLIGWGLGLLLAMFVSYTAVTLNHRVEQAVISPRPRFVFRRGYCSILDYRVKFFLGFKLRTDQTTVQISQCICMGLRHLYKLTCRIWMTCTCIRSSDVQGVVKLPCVRPSLQAHCTLIWYDLCDLYTFALEIPAGSAWSIHVS